MATHLRLQLQAEQIADLAAIRDLGADALSRVVTRLRSLEQGQPPLRSTDLHNLIKAELGGDTAKTQSLLRPLLAFHYILRQRATTPEDLIEGVTSAIGTTDPPWTDKQIAAWKEISPYLLELIRASVVRNVCKALELAYEYANLLQVARIVTDIRPIFDDDREREPALMRGAVVSFTLRLHFDSREGSHSLSIALDQADVEKLEEECRWALKKALAARKQMMENSISTIITGESHSNDDSP